MVPSLPKARTNRAEAVVHWQTERARPSYYNLLQVSNNAFEQNNQRSCT